MGNPEVFNYSPSGEQLRQLHSLLEIISTCQASGINVWVTGGYAIDALYGSLTRDHHDFDMYVNEASKEEFEKIIEKLGYQPSSEKVGQIGKNVHINPSFSPALRLEFGTIEQGMEFFKKIFEKEPEPAMIATFKSEVPLGNLEGTPIFVPPLEMLKLLIAINDKLAESEYPHREWLDNMLEILERRFQAKQNTE